MAVRHEITPDPSEHSHGAAVARTSYWERFTAAQAIMIALGVFFIVTGGVGLARAGAEQLTAPRIEVWGLGMTPLLAAIHLIAGLVALLRGAGPASARSTGIFLGAILIAAGLVATIQQVGPLGWDTTNGLAYLIAGAVSMIAALLTPAGVVERRVIAH